VKGGCEWWNVNMSYLNAKHKDGVSTKISSTPWNLWKQFIHLSLFEMVFKAPYSPTSSLICLVDGKLRYTIHLSFFMHWHWNKSPLSNLVGWTKRTWYINHNLSKTTTIFFLRIQNNHNGNPNLNKKKSKIKILIETNIPFQNPNLNICTTIKIII
jgi:hypothetical protein